MKKCIISIILIIIFIFTLELPHYTLAEAGNLFGSEFSNEFKPNAENPGTLVRPIAEAIKTITKYILNFLQIIGGIGAIVSIAIYGFKHILGADPKMARDLGISLNDRGSPDMRIELYDWARVMLIGSIILFFSSTFVKIVYNFLVE